MKTSENIIISEWEKLNVLKLLVYVGFTEEGERTPVRVRQKERERE
jgi:hypothetical protein